MVIKTNRTKKFYVETYYDDGRSTISYEWVYVKRLELVYGNNDKKNDFL